MPTVRRHVTLLKIHLCAFLHRRETTLNVHYPPVWDFATLIMKKASASTVIINQLIMELSKTQAGMKAGVLYSQCWMHKWILPPNCAYLVQNIFSLFALLELHVQRLSQAAHIPSVLPPESLTQDYISSFCGGGSETL